MRGHENTPGQIFLGGNRNREEQTRPAIDRPTAHSISSSAEAPLIAVPRASGEESSQQRFHALPSACQRWLERYGGWIVIAFIASMAIYILALNALGHVPGRSIPLKLGSDLLQLTGEIIGLLFCLYSVTRLRIGWIRMYQEQKSRAEISSALAELSAQTLRARRRAWIAWVFLTLGIGLYACGQVVWTNYDIRMSSSQSSAPGFYNLCFAASYPAFLIGTLLLARRRRNIINQACLALDALAILVAGFALAWFFVLRPTIAALSGSFSAEVISLYFPSIDLFMVAVAILLMFSPLSLPSHRPVLRRLCLGLVLLVVVDSLLGYLSLTPSGFNTGTLQDILRPLSMMFISLAAIEYSRGVARERALRAEHRSQLPRSVPAASGHYAQTRAIARAILPVFLAVLTSAVLLIKLSTRGGAVLFQADLVALALMVIVVMRQALTMRETLLAQQVIEKNNRMLEQTNAQLTALATTDMLTGLINHHTVQTQLEQACERAYSSNRPLSILFFDGDHFKRVNDTYGHAIGDIVLRELAERARSVLRSEDIVGRFGGEEFLALLPETDTSEARIVAERLRDAVAAAPLACSEVEHGIAITVSIGLASCPTDGTTPSQIQEQADQAMYWAKRLGRNRVCTVAEATLANSDAQLKMATTHMLQRQEVTMLDTCHPEQPLWAAQLGLIYALMGALDTRESGMGKRTHEMSDLITSLARSVAEALAEVECRGGTQIDPALLPVMQDVLYQQLEEQKAPRKSTRHLASSAS